MLYIRIGGDQYLELSQRMRYNALGVPQPRQPLLNTNYTKARYKEQPKHKKYKIQLQINIQQIQLQIHIRKTVRNTHTKYNAFEVLAALAAK